MRFFLDASGYPDIEANEDFRILTDFIKDDIQRSVYGVDGFIKACELIKSGALPLWEGTGNSHTVIIKPNYVEIFNEYTEDVMGISSINEFEEYLKKWKLLISN